MGSRLSILWTARTSLFIPFTVAVMATIMMQPSSGFLAFLRALGEGQFSTWLKVRLAQFLARQFSTVFQIHFLSLDHCLQMGLKLEAISQPLVGVSALLASHALQ